MATSVKISDLRGSSQESGGGGPSGVGGISLVGPKTVTTNSTNQYEITNYDDFSVYSFSVSEGTVGAADEIVTVDVPQSPSGNYITLTISRNGDARNFPISIDGTGVGVVTPSITYPTNNSTQLNTSLTLKANSFATIPANSGVLQSSEWQLSESNTFSPIKDSATISVGDLTQWTVSGLEKDTQYYARMRYTADVGTSGWANTIKFKTIEQTIDKPVVGIVGSRYDVDRTPTFNTTAFSVSPSGSDSHVATEWVLRTANDGNVVWTKTISSGNRTAITLPDDILVVSTEYTIEAKHIGGFTQSDVSEPFEFETADKFGIICFSKSISGYSGYNLLFGSADSTSETIILLVSNSSGSPLKILKSTDNGGSFSEKYSTAGPAASNHLSQKNSNGSGVWLVRSSHADYPDQFWILKSVDDGDTWTKLSGPTNYDSFSSPVSIGGSKWFSYSSSLDKLYLSTNNGGNWAQNSKQPTKKIREIASGGGTTLIVNISGAVYRTTDDGANFSQPSIIQGAHGNLNTDGNGVWMMATTDAGSDKTPRATISRDNGDTWSVVPLPSSPKPQWQQFARVVSGGDGRWVITDDGGFFETVDNGYNWSYKVMPSMKPYVGVFNGVSWIFSKTVNSPSLYICQ